VTRPRGQATSLMREINLRGGEAVLFPVLTITDPPSWGACDRAVRTIDLYDAIIFTSVNSVSRFFARARLYGVHPPAVPCYAVGDETRRALEREGAVVAARQPDESTAEGLVALLETVPQEGKRFLLPQGNRARALIRDAIRLKGGEAVAIVVYETRDADPGDARAILRELEDGMIDVVTFASPSAVIAFFGLREMTTLFRSGNRPILAVIGPTTRKAVEDLGWVPEIVATQPTASGLADAIEEYYKES